MVFTSLLEITRWGNAYSRLLGALGPSPRPGGGLRAPFLFGYGVSGMVAHLRPPGCISSVFLRLVQRDVPVKSRFLVSPTPDSLSAPSERGSSGYASTRCNYQVHQQWRSRHPAQLQFLPVNWLRVLLLPLTFCSI
jgi:hypothetical protein